MQGSEIHGYLLSYEKYCYQNQVNDIPLKEKIIIDQLRTIGLAMPKSTFIMWVKKCWKFLFCADEKMKTTEAKANQNLN